MNNSEYVLEMIDICKQFSNVQVLNNVCLKVRKGTVHALMGENGAGKSTLMKCLFGIYSKDSGEIYYNGEKANINGPFDALSKGIAMVHQELQPIPERSIAENIFCGRYPLKSIGPIKIIDHKKMYDETKKYLDAVGLNIDPKEKLGNLSVSQMQSVEIAKAVSVNAKIVIMDEPTSSLTENEVENLFRIINKLRSEGVAIIYISHKMEEILKISDEVSILRDGQTIGTFAAKDLTTDMIIKYMVGRELTNRFPEKDYEIGDEILRVENFTSINDRSFRDINFTVRSGEIFGIGGLVGAQRTELMEGIFGIRHKKSGRVIYKGEEIGIKKPRNAILRGLAMLTEDRRRTGIFGVLSIEDNIAIASLDKYLDYGIILNAKKIDQVVEDNINKMSIKAASKKTAIQNLSGGNQQKVVIARWLANAPDVLILDEPTRGIDVGAKYEIYLIMRQLAKQGKAIIMISSEMPELLGMSDRIMVMCEGKQTGILNKEEATQEKVMELATKFM